MDTKPSRTMPLFAHANKELFHPLNSLGALILRKISFRLVVLRLERVSIMNPCSGAGSGCHVKIQDKIWNKIHEFVPRISDLVLNDSDNVFQG